jgi:GT2 family glycosyltransferase
MANCFFPDNENLPLVYVIVLTWNQYLLTAKCIHSLLDVDYPNLRIIVVDNGSKDDTVMLLTEEFGQKIEILINETNLGYAGGNNVGIRHALQCGAEYIMVLNNDTFVSPDFLKPLLRTLQSNIYIGAVTPKIYFAEQPNMIWAAGGRINFWAGKTGSRGRGSIDIGQFDRSQEVDYTTGCCFLAPRNVFEQIGVFNESYFAYFEDTDWSMRVRKSGLKIWYEPAACIWHVAGGSSEKLANSIRYGHRKPFLIYLLARNNLWFIKSHISGMKKLTALVYFLVSYVAYYSVAYLILRRWEKLRNLWKGIQDGWRSLPE